MVVFVVLNCFVYSFFVEPQLSFKLRDYFSTDVELLVVMTETSYFWLVQLVKGMLSDAIDIDTFLRICFKNSGDKVFGIGRQKFR
jgi:hypothetical protein